MAGAKKYRASYFMAGAKQYRASYFRARVIEKWAAGRPLGMCRFKRLTNAFSKKLDNPLNMLSLYFVHYSFVGIHKSL